MWLDRKTYDDLRVESATKSATVTEQAGRIAALEATIEWLRIRVSQIEMERAQLLYQFMGVKVTPPQIERSAPSQVADALSSLPHFGDMGDDLAKKMGIGWNEDGSLKYENAK